VDEAEKRFLADLSIGIIESGGTAIFNDEKSMELAQLVLAKLREIGPFAYPSLLDQDGLRFVYQWDENPPKVVIMLWDEYMWYNMAHISVPKPIDDEINQ
jgi:hypothetical protein